MSIMTIRLTLMLGALALPLHAVEAQTVRGLLLERDTGLAIDLGRIALVDEEGDSLATSLTDADGFFSIEAGQGGSYRLVATALGYRGSVVGPYELEAGDTRVVEVQLSPSPVPLVGLEVSAERLNEPEVANLTGTGFYDRLSQRRGEFLTPGEIADSRILHTPQLFREMKTIYLARPVGDRASAPWNDRVMIRKIPTGPSRSIEERVCVPRIYVDDVMVDLESMDPEPSLEDLAPRAELEAVEVYRSIGAPNRYLSTSDCGVILLWTKARGR